jgi:hypothetical protein
MGLGELANLLEAERPEIGSNSPYTVIRRLLDTDWFQRDEHDRLTVLFEDRAGIISEGYLWAPKEGLQFSDIASYRREGLLHLLKGYERLRMGNILVLLKEADWFKIEADKDAVKGDLRALLKERRVRRGEDGLWEAVVPTTTFPL